MVNGDFSIALGSCMTGQVESLHSTHHHKHEAGAHVIDYSQGFGNTVKEGLKKTTLWAAHYFTNKKSYSPVPSNSARFWGIPFLPPLPTVSIRELKTENRDRKPLSTRQVLFPLTCKNVNIQLAKKTFLRPTLLLILMQSN